MKAKEMIVSLIADDLVHFKLIEGLDTLGLDTTIYSIDIGSTILKLMNVPVEHDEKLFVYYLSLRTPALSIDLHDGNHHVRKLAVAIYEKLEKKKRRLMH